MWSVLGLLDELVIVDETWIHLYSPEKKEQTKQWIVKGERAPKKRFKWHYFVDYLEKGQAITGPSYAPFLGQLNDEI